MFAPQSESFRMSGMLNRPPFASSGEGERSISPSFLRTPTIHQLVRPLNHISIFDTFGNAVDEVRQPDPCVFPRFVPARGYEEYPYRGQGLGLALPGFLLRPFPRFGPCRARLPWRVRLWVVPPLARLPRRVGGPLPFVAFCPLFCFCFVA